MYKESLNLYCAMQGSHQATINYIQSIASNHYFHLNKFDISKELKQEVATKLS